MHHLGRKTYFLLLLALFFIFPLAAGMAEDEHEEPEERETRGNYIVIAYNDLGMHCMNSDYSVAAFLPPYNNLVAQVIQRGEEPRIVTQGIKVEYQFLQNTTCQGSNFWEYAPLLFGVDLPHCIGLSGKALSGTMELEGKRFIARGIPVTPYDDQGLFNPYPLVEVVVKDENTEEILATTVTVAPVSTEMNCHRCHGGNGGRQTMLNILKKHDEEEGTDLTHSTPVLCQNCHADPALGQRGNPDLPSLSLAMHGKHAEARPRPGCLDCHPGPVTQCLRTDISEMQSCEACHGDLQAMASSLRNGRQPWIEEPKCSQCHGGPEMDTGSRLYKDAQGHHGIYCATCHYSPHAWWPSRLARDNYQVLLAQGEKDPLGENCLVCHTSLPEEAGPHGKSPSAEVEVVNVAPDTPIVHLGTLYSPVSSPAARLFLNVDQELDFIVMPSVQVPLERRGETATLYYMSCRLEDSWCTDIISIMTLRLGYRAYFPIFDNPIASTRVLPGTYQIYIGFSHNPDFSDLLYSFYEVVVR